MAGVPIQQIKEQLQQASIEELDALILHFQSDKRSTVKKELERAGKRILAYEQELKRLEQMKEYETKYNMYSYICGIDEVGRGPLAGPVVACAVILKEESCFLHLNDSKQVSEKRREELYEQIIAEAVSYGLGFVSPERIDEINILQATYEAMREAISNLKVKPDILLNDAVTIPGVDIKQVPIIKGDAKSVSIAAASVVAKVTRDRMMKDYDLIMPEYGFASNKGYGSADHIEALKKYGPSAIHRKSFIKNLIG